jgi:hypothetical protein
LGLKAGEEACNILSARLIERFPLAKANEAYFLTYGKITTENTVLSIDENFTIEIGEKGEVYIINLPIHQVLPLDEIKTMNQKLSLYIKTLGGKYRFTFAASRAKQSVLYFNNLFISNPKHSLKLDDSYEISPPVEISLSKDTISIIVGKERKF